VTRRLTKAASPTVEIDGRSLHAVSVTAVARHGAKVVVSAAGRDRLEASWRRAARVAAGGALVYGRTTGVGAKLLEPVPAGEGRHHSLAILRSHAAGVGRVLGIAEVRALLLVRANQLLVGGSGIDPAVVDAILAALESGATPVVHELGGIGTGDLTAMAEVGLALAGEGAWLEGSAPPDAVEFGAGDGLALMSSNACTLGRAALLAVDADRVLRSVDAVVGLSVLACRGSLATFDPRVHAARPLGGPSVSAQRVRAIVGEDAPGVGARLQDPYGLRCAPQLDGAALGALDRLVDSLELDMNAATENPLIAGGDLARPPSGADAGGGAGALDVALPNGNFLLSELAGALDHLRNALAGVGLGSLARLSLVCDPAITGVTRFLTDGTPGASGVMILEYTAQAAMDRLRLAATSTSCWPVTVSAGIESLASHAPLGVEQLGDAIEALSVVVGAELVANVRAIGLQRVVPDSPAGRAALERVRAALSSELADRPLGEDVTAAASLVSSDLTDEARR
jgi:histidine ammonia-lyase